MADLSGCCVMSVGYRLAPEHKFPTALMDAAASLRWLVDNSAEFNIDPDRVAVAGDSAGANLAAVLAILSRDGDLPPIRSQILIYPVTDLSMSMASHAENMPGVRFTSASMRWFRDHYLRAKADSADWRASPVRQQLVRHGACVHPDGGRRSASRRRLCLR
ncbi:alpha/beta hydrolase [Mesorhizobium sp. ORM6]